ncbi:nucleotide exchange factor SIL1 isoform X1 [Siphateles boraxobius]|uniref:nucleotide exchange factor SIL1 isoform X1 n=1 Tax=Siphateles boraxobius TaxID=180520 RepID=UPI0040630DDD
MTTFKMQNKWSIKLGVAITFWLFSLHLISAHNVKSPTALSVKEGSGDHSKGEVKQLENEDPEDLEVFTPTDKWQTLKPGHAVPAGSHVRLNLQTGHREVKMGEEAGLKYGSDGNGYSNRGKKYSTINTVSYSYVFFFPLWCRQGMMNMHGPSYTAEELKEALKKIKEGMNDPVDTKQEEDAVKAQFRPIEELKKDMEALDMLVETDVQVMRKLLNQFNNTNSTTDEKVTALLDLEYLVHQVDNARNLVSMGGMQLVINALNGTDIRLQESAAFVLGSAVSSNPSVQVEAVEGGALQKLLTLLATQRPIAVKKKVLFAVASLLRHFPFAQSHFLKLGGVQMLSELFQTPGAEALRVRIITVLYDMIIEKELISQVGMDLIPDSSHQERLRQYGEVSLLPVLAEQGWCRLVPELLASPEHDWREKALRTLLAMMAQCHTQYKQNPSLTASLSELQKQYQELVLTEQDLGEQDGYFGEILALVDSMVVKMQQV